MGVWCWEFHYKFDFFKHLTHEKKKKQWYKNLRYLELHQISKFSSDESLFFLICDIKNCINYPSFPVMEVCFFLFLYFPNRSPIKVSFKLRAIPRDQSNFPLGPALYRWRGDEMFPLLGGLSPYLSWSACLPDILHHLWDIRA